MLRDTIVLIVALLSLVILILAYEWVANRPWKAMRYGGRNLLEWMSLLRRKDTHEEAVRQIATMLESGDREAILVAFPRLMASVLY